MSKVCSISYCDSKTSRPSKTSKNSIDNSEECEEGYEHKNGKPTQPILNVSFHTIPKNSEMLQSWMLAINSRPGAKRTSTWIPMRHSTVCSKHFTSEDYEGRGILKEDAVPSIFPVKPKQQIAEMKKVPNIRSSNLLGKKSLKCQATISEESHIDKCIQVDVLTNRHERNVKRLKLENKEYANQISEIQKCIASCKKSLNELNKAINSPELKQLEYIQTGCINKNVKAAFLIDQLNNFDKRQPTWSEITLKLCTDWRDASGKSYAHVRTKNLMSCPSRSTLERYNKEKLVGEPPSKKRAEETENQITVEIQMPGLENN